MHLKPQILGTLHHKMATGWPVFVNSFYSGFVPLVGQYLLTNLFYLIFVPLVGQYLLTHLFYLVFVTLVGQYLLTHFIQDLCHWLAQCRRLTREMKWAWHSLQGSIYTFHHHQHLVLFTILHLSPHLCGTKSDWRQYSIFAIFAPACVKEKNNYWQTANCVCCMEFS